MTTSLERVLYLKNKLDEVEFYKFSLEDLRFTEVLIEFRKNFIMILSKMQSIDPKQELMEAESAERNRFLQLYVFNRKNYFQEKYAKPQLSQYAVCEDQISCLTKKFIQTLEIENLCPDLIKSYCQNGIYDILHHGDTSEQSGTDQNFFGKKSQLFAGPRAVKYTLAGLAICALAIAFFATVVLLGLSGGWVIAATVLFGSSITYMTGLLYGISNNFFAAKANLPYFLFGCRKDQRISFRSNDVLVQAIGWAAIGAGPITCVAAFITGAAIFVSMMISSAAILTFILPIMLVAIPLFALCVNAYAKYRAEKYMKEGIPLNLLSESSKTQLCEELNLSSEAKKVSLDAIDFDSASMRKILRKDWNMFNKHQLIGIAALSYSKKDKANWMANYNRYAFGLKSGLFLGFSCLGLMLTLNVPVVFLSPLFAVFIPVASAIIALTILIGALTYTWANKDKQVNDRYRFFTNVIKREAEMDKLYMPELQSENNLIQG